MLSSESHDENRCGFFSLLENKVHQLNIPNTRYLAQTSCCGSSQGWLLLVEKRSPSLFLFNPITCIQIHLPPITAFPDVLDFNVLNVGEEYLIQNPYFEEPDKYSLDYIRYYFIKKISLFSNNPTSLNEEYIVIAIAGLYQQLAFCKKEDEKWTVIKDVGYANEDVIYYKGLIYAVNKKGNVAICDLRGSSPLVTIIAPPPTHNFILNMLHLVTDSYGELLLVNKLLCCLHDDNLQLIYPTERFEVFRLDSNKPEWVEVKSLGDRMLFLGANSSLCLSATDFPGCEGNCIYFTPVYTYDGTRWKHDYGVFNVGDGSMKTILPCFTESQISLPPLIWLTPNPC